MDDTGASTDREERLRRERLARRVAILSMVLLGLGVVALYAWIQGRPSAGETDTGAPLFSTLAPGGATNPVQGDPAADFTVAIFGGGEFSLGGHLAADGRPVFLNLWASWCEPCKAEMPALDAASQRHPGVKFIGVAVQDDLDRAADFAAEIGHFEGRVC